MLRGTMHNIFGRESERERKRNGGECLFAFNFHPTQGRHFCLLATPHALFSPISHPLSVHTHSYNDQGIWNWNVHDGDWIYQGGPDSTTVKNAPYFNEWSDLDDSPVGWHITEVCVFYCSCLVRLVFAVD